jgi:hypothetical protein
MTHFLKKAFNKVAAQIPVIGPHGGIEADLLLAGIKPVGCLTVWSDEDRRPLTREDYIAVADEKEENRQRQKLDRMVEKGELVSVDLLLKQYEGQSDHVATVFRAYGKPGSEADLQAIAAYHDTYFKSFGREQGVLPPHLDGKIVEKLAGARAMSSGTAEFYFTKVNRYNQPYDLSLKDRKELLREHEGRKLLDQKVAAGELKSADLMSECGWITRFYCQPGKEADMQVMIDYHAAGFQRGKLPDDRGVGDYLGYRKRDQKYWVEGLPVYKALGKLLPDKVVSQLEYFVNVHIAQPAYQAEMLDKAKEINNGKDFLPRLKR